MITYRITDPALVPAEFIDLRGKTLTPDQYENFLIRVKLKHISPCFDHAKIRAALEEKCERCGGKGEIREPPCGQSELLRKCTICHGTGLRQIPGVERVSE